MLAATLRSKGALTRTEFGITRFRITGGGEVVNNCLRRIGERTAKTFLAVGMALTVTAVICPRAVAQNIVTSPPPQIDQSQKSLNQSNRREQKLPVISPEDASFDSNVVNTDLHTQNGLPTNRQAAMVAGANMDTGQQGGADQYQDYAAQHEAAVEAYMHTPEADKMDRQTAATDQQVARMKAMAPLVDSEELALVQGARLALQQTLAAQAKQREVEACEVRAIDALNAAIARGDTAYAQVIRDNIRLGGADGPLCGSGGVSKSASPPPTLAPPASPSLDDHGAPVLMGLAALCVVGLTTFVVWPAIRKSTKFKDILMIIIIFLSWLITLPFILVTLVSTFLAKFFVDGTIEAAKNTDNALNNAFPSSYPARKLAAGRILSNVSFGIKFFVLFICGIFGLLILLSLSMWGAQVSGN